MERYGGLDGGLDRGLDRGLDLAPSVLEVDQRERALESVMERYGALWRVMEG